MKSSNGKDKTHTTKTEIKVDVLATESVRPSTDGPLLGYAGGICVLHGFPIDDGETRRKSRSKIINY